jgi:hypothetical protein
MENMKNTTPVEGSIGMLSSLQVTADTAGLDKASKNVMHNIEVLATILKNAVPEYRNYTKEEIMEFIDRDSCSEETEVSPGRTNTELHYNSTEYISLGEKTSNFDYLFDAKNPELSEGIIRIKLHFDMEPQRDYRPGYPVEKRAYYYLARRFSSQLSVALEESDYGKLEKCYGIWICRDNIPKNERYTVSMYEIANTRNIGECSPKKEDYDLMTLILIRLGDVVYNGKEEDEGYELLDFLNLIMYPHKDNFMEEMSKYIDFSNNEELWKEAKHMSGLGISVLEEGQSEGMSKMILGFLEDYGDVSEELRNEIYSQKNPEILQKWGKLAAKAGSIEEFEEAIGLARL